MVNETTATTEAQPPREDPSPPARGRLWRALRRLVAVSCVGYLVLVVALWLTLRLAADRWWVATVVMFSPRWVWGLPLAVLFPLALVTRRPRSILLTLVTAAVWAGPVMGLCVPWRRVLAPDEGPRLRVLTCNADGSRLDPRAFDALVKEWSPDVVVLQSLASSHRELFLDRPGWRFVRQSELSLAVRESIVVSDVTRIEDEDTGGGIAGAVAAVYRLQTSSGPVALANVHLATPRQALEAVIRLDPDAGERTRRNVASRRRQFEALARWARVQREPVILAGDFNTLPESALFREHLGGYANAYSVAGFGWGNTHFTRRTAVRIDHVMTGAGWTARRCRVGPDVGSAHRPVVADLVRAAP